MSSDPVQTQRTGTPAGGAEAPRAFGRRKAKKRSTLHAYGEPMVWLTGGALAVALFMIVGLLLLVFWQGMITFWPAGMTRIAARDGKVFLGQIIRREEYRPQEVTLQTLAPEVLAAARRQMEENGGKAGRRLVRIGNYEITQEHFCWIDDFMVAEETRPEWAALVERLEWGRFYGIPRQFLLDGKVVADTPEGVWKKFEEYHGDSRSRWRQRKSLEKHDIGHVNHQLERARLDLKEVELESGKDSEAWRSAEKEFKKVEAGVEGEYARIQAEIAEIEKENERYQVVFDTYHGDQVVPATLPLSTIVRAFLPNRVSFFQKVGIYIDRWVEFLFDEPRQANSEGGVWPAIFGTVVMTLIMCIFVVPFGVLAALYLREYARAGFIVSAVRIAINNLAGVPSIVFGVFGLGFFCYIIGASIDELFFEARLPGPTYGTGGVLWASLTLALLTLPVVIVATEEALSAVPSSMREGSYACGASKWQTIQRIVLPRAMPGIMTGMILAMARGAGEVAPLMLVGAVKLAPTLPVDGIFPYLHPERSFMHLGFHIYDLGFQSQNSEAAKPMVYTTTFLLIAIVATLNLFAIWLRARLRREFLTDQF
jgi:phosphate transport system permease protein